MDIELPLDFGIKVKISARLLREKHKRNRTWAAYDYPSRGIIIGRRTIWNGTVTHYDNVGEVTGEGDGYPEFKPAEKIRVYLVAIPGCNPVYCLPEHIEGYLPMKEEQD